MSVQNPTHHLNTYHASQLDEVSIPDELADDDNYNLTLLGQATPDSYAQASRHYNNFVRMNNQPAFGDLKQDDIKGDTGEKLGLDSSSYLLG